MIPIIGTKHPKSRTPPGWADFYGLQSSGNTKGEVDTYTFALPRGYTRVMVLAIGVGGASCNRDNWGGGGSGAGAAKAGYILTPGDVLTIQVPRASANLGGNDTSFNAYQAPAAIVTSAKRGALLRANAGINSNYSDNPAGGTGQLLIASDFNVQNGGTYTGGSGFRYNGDYQGLYAGDGAGYAGGGGAGGHGNYGGSHGALQNAAAFNNSRAEARQKFGDWASVNKTSRGSNSWNYGTTNDTAFGGGSGGHSSGSTPVYPGRSFVRIVWGLTPDGGPINPTSHGW